MTDIETRLFRYFVTVADEKHFARAAARLGISPPTLTNQIKTLERQLGVPLFVRKTKSATVLTAAGNRFLDRARRVLVEIDEAATSARQAARGEIGQLSVGLMPSAICAGLVHRFLGEFQKANPQIDINLQTLSPMAQLTGVMQNTLDFAFTRCPHKYPPSLTGFNVYNQPLVLALPSDHPLARFEKINPRLLKDELFINTSADLDVGFAGHTEAVATIGGFTPKIAKRVGDFTTILSYVSLGRGIGVISQPMTRLSVPNVVFRELTTNPPPVAPIAFVYRRDDPSPAGKLLLTFMRPHALLREEKSWDRARIPIDQGELV